MDSASIGVIRDNITEKLQSLVSNGSSMRSFLLRSIYPMYQQFQLDRFQSENSTEGFSWPSLSSRYAARKRIMFGGGPKFEFIGGRGAGRPWIPKGTWPSFPGGGSKMMIATGRLASAAIGPNPIWSGGESFHRMIVTDTSLSVRIDGSRQASKKDPGSEYFKYAAEKRPFMKFSQAHISQMKDAVKAYVKGSL